MDIDTYMVDVLYEVHRSDNLEILLGGGLHALDFGVGIAGRIEVDGEVRETATAGETATEGQRQQDMQRHYDANDRQLATATFIESLSAKF